MVKNKVLPEKEGLEYQKSQDSAEHYNTMIWTLISIGIGFTLTILYIVLSQEQDILLELGMLFVGAFILFYFSYLIESANEKKNFKYAICKKIEKRYGFIGQHLNSDRLPISQHKMGIAIMRVLKLTLFFIYLIMILSVGLIALSKEYSNTLLISWIFIFIASIGSVAAEFYYWTRKQDFNRLLNKD